MLALLFAMHCHAEYWEALRERKAVLERLFWLAACGFALALFVGVVL